ncbi:molybdopterin converting factor subunit 1 [Porticoccus sp. GXU_MW_L64]
MTIELKYFAALRDHLQTDGEQLDAVGVCTVAELRQLLSNRGGVWSQHLLSDHTLAAVNQQMATPQTSVNDGDEVAFFPPVTGG